MATVGTRLRSVTVTAAVVLVTASWLTTAPAANAATPDPSSTAQPSPTPQPTTSSAGTADGPGLTLDPTSARPDDAVAVSFDGWDVKGCTLDYDQAAQPTSTCTVVNGLLSGTVTVPSDATPNTAVPITACPTECTGDNVIATALLNILPPLATSQPTAGGAVGAVPVKPPPTHRHHAATSTPGQTATSTPGHTTALVAGGAVVVFLASGLGLLLLRRRPPTIGQPPDITLVPRPDPGVVTVDPANAPIRLEARITIRLRPDLGRCRVEVMHR